MISFSLLIFSGGSSLLIRGGKGMAWGGGRKLNKKKIKKFPPPPPLIILPNKGRRGGRFPRFATELTSTYLVYNYFLHNSVRL